MEKVLDGGARGWTAALFHGKTRKKMKAAFEAVNKTPGVDDRIAVTLTC